MFSRPRIFLAALGTILTLSPAQAADDRLDGLWGGGYGIGGSQFTASANLDVAQGYGEMKLNVGTSISFNRRLRSGEQGLPQGNRFQLPGEDFAATSYGCTYFVRLDGETLDLALNLQTSNPVCDNRATATISAEGPDGPVLSYRSEHVDLSFPLRLGIGPLPADQLATLPPAFDILGVTPGMTIDAAAQALIDQGFTPFEPPRDPTITAPDWSQTTRQFTRGEQFGSPDFPEFPDIVTLLESTAYSLDPDAPTLVLLVGRTRSWRATQGDGIAPDTLFDQITGKYGLPSNGAVSTDFGIYFDKQGQQAERGSRQNAQSCFNAAQSVQYQTPYIPLGRLRLQLDPSPACGSTFRFSADTKGSVVDAFSLLIYSEPLLVQDVWRRYAGQIATKARETFETLSSQTGDGKKLDL